MPTNIVTLIDFLDKCFKNLSIKRKKGIGLTYSNSSMLIFLLIVLIKKLYTFQGMEKFAKKHYSQFGWEKAPSRKTIRRRFLAMPTLIHLLMPQISKECAIVSPKIFGFSWAFVDKTIFRAMGGLWHKTQMKLGIAPHKSVDKDASWGYSPYHRWRFGYGLHLIANQNRFPIVACVTTAKAKDAQQVPSLVQYLIRWIGTLVGDAGYFATKIMQKLNKLGVFLYSNTKFTDAKSAFQKNYNDLVNTIQARLLYKKRKPSVEPVFALIKQIYDLNGNNQLPYKGLKKVESFLLITAISIQLMMFLNHLNKKELGNTDTILNII